MTVEQRQEFERIVAANCEAVAAIPFVTNANGEPVDPDWLEAGPMAIANNAMHVAKALGLPIEIDYSEHVCFDHACVRIMGIEYHKPECPKSKPQQVV